MRILVATNGSAGAAAAVRFAVWLAGQLRRAELTIAMAGDLRQEILSAKHEFSRATPFEQEECRSIRDCLKDARLEAARLGIRARVEYVQARGMEAIADALARTAQRRRAGLIVAGAESYRGLSRLVLGGTAHRLVRMSSRPVIIVPRSRILRKRAKLRILIATDGSTTARSALLFAARLASACRAAELEVISVGTLRNDLAQIARLRPSRSTIDELMKAERRVIQGILDRAARDLAAVRAPVRFRLVQPGRPMSTASAIAHEADRSHADLVVVGSQGRSALAVWALGSVAYRLLTSSHRPVTVVHPAAARRPRG